MANDACIIDTWAQEWRCNRCGDHLPELTKVMGPVPIDVWVGASRGWSKVHRRCQNLWPGLQDEDEWLGAWYRLGSREWGKAVELIDPPVPEVIPRSRLTAEGVTTVLSWPLQVRDIGTGVVSEVLARHLYPITWAAGRFLRPEVDEDA